MSDATWSGGGGIPAWRQDPTGRFPWRYWDGQRWTEHVADGARQSVDPYPPGPAPAPGSFGGQPGPARWAPPPAPGSGRRGLTTAVKVLIFGGVAVVLIGAAVAVFAVRAVVLEVKGPVDEANRYFAELEREDYPAAYGRLCREISDAVGPEEWASDFREGMANGVGIRTYNVWGSNVQGDEAILTATLSTDAAEAEMRVRMRREGGRWRVCGVQFVE